MKKILIAASLLLALALAYLLLWPLPLQPQAWTAPHEPGYVGPHAPNTRLSGLSLIDLGDEVGPEHVAFGPDGMLYTTMLSGNILRMQPDGSGCTVFANTGGRVLGFDFDAAGNLIAADAMQGLLSISPQGNVRLLTDRVGNSVIGYANSVVVVSDGQIYLSDASTRFAPKSWGGTFQASVLDIMEQSATGRVIAYDPATQRTRVVAHGLSFANGLALSEDGKSLFVNETGRYRVWNIAVAAQDLDIRHPSKQARIVLDNLPGYPDNLMRGKDGRLWLGFAKPRNAVIDKLADKPLLRAMVLRLPRSLWPIPKAYGHVIAFDENGRILADLQDPSGAYPETTAVTEHGDRLYIQSLHAKGLGWAPKSVLTQH